MSKQLNNTLVARNEQTGTPLVGKKIRLNSFRQKVILRILLLVTSIFAIFQFFFKPGFHLSEIILGIMILYQIYGLIHYVEKTNRDLSHFFQSIREDDFTQSFSYCKQGDSYDELRKSFNQVTEQFLKLRSEKETQFNYLQTLVKHVKVGLILFKTDGSVELINTAAKHLLHINSLNNINGLERIGKPLVDTILRLKPGESTALKLESNQDTLYLSIRATQLKLRGEWHTLISLQNIQGEIQREQMAKELEIAWDVQKSLLPDKNPIVPGYDIAGICKPAKEVGGDYYDFIPLGKNKLAIVISDVSGKGTQASFYMTLTKGFIMSLMKENKSLKRVLIEINELMVKTIKKKVFVTMYLVILDWNLNRLLCARAGHNPALHYSSNKGECAPVKPEGMALGLIENSSFSDTIQEFSLDLVKNDWLILYTDGLTEAMNSELKGFGERGLIETIKGNLNASASQMTETIFENVQDYACCDVHHDDMTLISIKRI